MNEKNSLLTSPQLDYNGQRALALSAKQTHSLYKKSKEFGVPFDVIEQVYIRGYTIATSDKEQAGFNRVASFLNGGKAAELDNDLLEGIGKVIKQIAADVLKTAFPSIGKHATR